MTLTAPSALWLLLVVPLIWVAHFAGRTNFTSRQRWLQTVVRSLLLACLAFALARPVISTASSRESVIYIVDVSHSISSTAIEGAAGTIDELNRQLRPDHHRVIAFAAEALALDNTGALRGLARIEEGVESRLDRSGTDLEAAFAAARAELAPGHVPRFVLFTDGRQTAGDTGAAIARLASEQIPVSVLPLAVRSLGDTWIDAIDVPAKIVAGGMFATTVVVGSQRPAIASVEVRIDGKALATRQLPVDKGTTRASLDVVIEAPGPSVMQAVVTVPGDPLTSNNTLNRGIWTHPHPKVLYIEGRLSSARYLSAALTGSGTRSRCGRRPDCRGRSPISNRGMSWC